MSTVSSWNGSGRRSRSANGNHVSFGVQSGIRVGDRVLAGRMRQRARPAGHMSPTAVRPRARAVLQCLRVLTWATIRTCRNWLNGFGFGRTKPRPLEPMVTGSNPVGPRRDAVPCEPIAAVVPCPRRDAGAVAHNPISARERDTGERRPHGHHMPDRGQAHSPAAIKQTCRASGVLD